MLFKHQKGIYENQKNLFTAFALCIGSDKLQNEGQSHYFFLHRFHYFFLHRFHFFFLHQFHFFLHRFHFFFLHRFHDSRRIRYRQSFNCTLCGRDSNRAYIGCRGGVCRRYDYSHCFCRGCFPYCLRCHNRKSGFCQEDRSRT